MNAQRRSVNLVPGMSAPAVLHASEGDVGRVLEIVIIDGQLVYNIPSTATVTITATKPSGMGFTQTCTVTENGTATFETTASMTDESGEMQAEVRIVDGGQNIGTANLLWIVERNPHPSNVIDGDVERAKTILERADEAMAKAEQMIEEVEIYNSIVKEVEDARNGFDGVTYGTLGESVRGQVSALKSVQKEIYDNIYKTITTDNYVEDDSSFWNQGKWDSPTLKYVVHSNPIKLTQLGALYFGGICTGTKFTNNSCIVIRIFDAENNLLRNSGSRTITETWAISGLSLDNYPTADHIVIDFTTQSVDIHVTPETFTANYKLYVGTKNITSFDDWYDHTVSVSIVQELEERVTAIEDDIPEYWDTYMGKKVERIRELNGIIGTHGTSFVFATDIHWQNNFKHTPALIKHILKHTAIDAIICGGDILTKNDSIQAALSVINDWGYNTNSLGTFNIYGNHDNNSNGGNASSLWIGYDRWYGALLKPIEQDVVWSDDKKYFYINNDVQKVRMIFLNSGYDQAIGIDVTQAGWLQRQLRGLTSGWKAIVFQHVVFNPATVASGTTELAFNSAGTMTKNMIDSQIPYMESNNIDFIGLVCGHVHRDYSIVTDNGYPIITTTCDANGLQASLYDPENPIRKEGTTTEQAFDVYQIDTDNRKIYITRIGAGSDREFDY